MTIYDFPTWFLRSVVIVLGLLWGSFLNVVIYRVPRDLSVVRPGSRCGACGTPIRAYDNIPVVSWLLLRGRARCCGAPISGRYPLVEILGGALSLAIFEVVVSNLPDGTSLAQAALVYVVDFAFALGLVAAAFIDAEHMYLPDSITLTGTALGIATASLHGLSWKESLFGAAVGFVGVWLPLIELYKRVRGQAGMGMGDAKLTMLAGAWFGWTGAVFVLLAGAVHGTIGAAIVYLVKGKIEEPEAVRRDREELQKLAEEGDAEAKEILAEDPLGEAPSEGFGRARLPFGPFLIVACLEYLLAGDWIVRTYKEWFFSRY